MHSHYRLVIHRMPAAHLHTCALEARVYDPRSKHMEDWHRVDETHPPVRLRSEAKLMGWLLLYTRKLADLRGGAGAYAWRGGPKGRFTMKGMSHTPETRAKISAAAREVWKHRAPPDWLRPHQFAKPAPVPSPAAPPAAPPAAAPKRGKRTPATQALPPAAPPVRGAAARDKAAPARPKTK